MAEFVQNHQSFLLVFFRVFHPGLGKGSVLSLLRVRSSLTVVPVCKHAYVVVVLKRWLKKNISMLQKSYIGKCTNNLELPLLCAGQVFPLVCFTEQLFRLLPLSLQIPGSGF